MGEGSDFHSAEIQFLITLGKYANNLTTSPFIDHFPYQNTWGKNKSSLSKYLLSEGFSK